MSIPSTMTFEERVNKAASILKTSPEIIEKALKKLGVENDEFALGFMASSALREDEIIQAIQHEEIGHDQGLPSTYESAFPLPRLRYAISILRGTAPEDPSANIKSPMMEEVRSQSEVKELTEAIIKGLAFSKPLEQMKTDELLRAYLAEDDQDLEAELIRRSYGKRFIVVRGSDNVDIELSLEILKRARKKEEIPTSYVGADGEFLSIYTVMEYSPASRVMEESPLSPSTFLFDGYCEASGINFTGIPLECRQIMRIIAVMAKDRGEALRKTEMRRMVEVARKGLQELAKEYPEEYSHFCKLKSVDMLPSLKRHRAPELRKSSGRDPFGVRA